MNFLNYHHLFYFWTVCQEGGFTKASVKLRLSQSAISEQVSCLEESLGQKLIERTTRSFQLTESGSVALKYADTIFSAGEELLDFMHHRPTKGRQTVRIGALGSLSRNLQIKFLKPLLKQTDIRFQIVVGDSNRLFKRLREHSLDVVLSTFPVGETEPGGALYTHLIAESPLCILARAHHKALKNKSISNILETEAVYLPSLSLESRADFDYFTETKGIKTAISGEVDDIALLRLLALSGNGVVVLPRMGVASDIENKSLIVLHEFKNIRQKFYAITRHKKVPNPIIAKLMQEIKNF